MEFFFFFAFLFCMLFFVNGIRTLVGPRRGPWDFGCGIFFFFIVVVVRFSFCTACFFGCSCYFAFKVNNVYSLLLQFCGCFEVFLFLLKKKFLLCGVPSFWEPFGRRQRSHLFWQCLVVLSIYCKSVLRKCEEIHFVLLWLFGFYYKKINKKQALFYWMFSLNKTVIKLYLYCCCPRLTVQYCTVV